MISEKKARKNVGVEDRAFSPLLHVIALLQHTSTRHRHILSEFNLQRLKIVCVFGAKCDSRSTNCWGTLKVSQHHPTAVKHSKACAHTHTHTHTHTHALQISVSNLLLVVKVVVEEEGTQNEDYPGKCVK